MFLFLISILISYLQLTADVFSGRHKSLFLIIFLFPLISSFIRRLHIKTQIQDRSVITRAALSKSDSCLIVSKELLIRTLLLCAPVFVFMLYFQLYFSLLSYNILKFLFFIIPVFYLILFKNKTFYLSDTFFGGIMAILWSADSRVTGWNDSTDILLSLIVKDTVRFLIVTLFICILWWLYWKIFKRKAGIE